MHGEHFRVAIIGTGFAGIGAAIRLLREGERDFVVLERAAEVGGVWRDNTYPGCACDVQSHLYSFSFAPNAHWTQHYSPQGEIWAYLKRCAEQFGVLSHVRFQHEVVGAAWDEAQQRWTIETSRGTFTAERVIAAVGGLSEPSTPDIEGLPAFAGKVMHSARWDHGYDLTGKRIAVIGTGASAIQFIPQLQPKVARLLVFQRTPPWVMPRRNGPFSPRTRRLLAEVPLLQRALRASLYVLRELLILAFRHPAVARLVQGGALRHMKRAIQDPALRAKLVPDYTIGCKRILVSDDYYPALAQPNVEVITAGVRRVEPHAIVDRDGNRHEVDAIILGTGFHVTDPPIGNLVRGRGGRTLAQAWQGSMKAHLGTMIAGFPNFFMLPGPNTGLGHTSVVIMAEAQIEHVIRVLRRLDGTESSAIEPTEAAQDAYIREVDRRMQGTVWLAGGCRSWYLDGTGRNSTLWPGSTLSFRRRLARFDPAEYRLTPRNEPRVAPISGEVEVARA